MAENDYTGVRVILWCVPRTISTALTKCLSHIDGMETWFEPFYFSYFAKARYDADCEDDLPMEYEANEERAVKAAQTAEVFTIEGTKLKPDRIT